MAYNSNITTSIRGRRLGLQIMSTAQTGGSRGAQEFLAGPEALRVNASTAETTSTNLHPFGISILTTASSSGVYTLDPPIPGVEKSLVFHTTGSNPIYVKTANGETIGSTQGTTMTVLASSQTAYAAVKLLAVSTSVWAVVSALSSAYLRAAATT